MTDQWLAVGLGLSAVGIALIDGNRTMVLRFCGALLVAGAIWAALWMQTAAWAEARITACFAAPEGCPQMSNWPPALQQALSLAIGLPAYALAVLAARVLGGPTATLIPLATVTAIAAAGGALLALRVGIGPAQHSAAFTVTVALAVLAIAVPRRWSLQRGRT